MIFKIAFRNIFRQKRRTILTALTMFGGFTLAAISIGWSDGSYSNIIDMFTRNQLGHIQVHKKGYLDKPSLYNTINNYETVGDKIQKAQGVQSWAPRLYSAGLVSIGDKSAGVQIVGIDPQREDESTRFNKKIIEGAPLAGVPAHEVLLGKGLAKILNAKLGDEVVIVSQAADGSIANDLYQLVGIVQIGEEISDRMSFYLHLKDAQELLALDSSIHEIIVIVHKLDEVAKVTDRIRQKLNNPVFDVESWQEFAKSFYVAMKADQEGMWIMLFVIILIVAVGVLNTVLMSVLERRREYGLLKAIGTKPGQIIWLVLTEIGILAIISVMIGTVLSIIINYLLSIHGISLPEPFRYGGIEFQKMYTEVNARSLYIPAITVILSSLIISLFPALKAARTEPARAMRIH